MKKTVFLTIAALALLAISLHGQVPEKPVPPRLVNDFAGIFNRQQADQLEQSLVQFNNETSTQIVVVTVKDLGGYDISDFSFRLGEKWGVGQKDKDNGVVIVLKPKINQESGLVFVAVGYGLEHLIPDAVANRQIVDYEMIPRFREGDYFTGVVNGIKVIMDLTRGEYTADKYTTAKKEKKKEGSLFGLVIFIFLIILFISRGRKNRFYSPGKALPWWLALTMLNSGRSSGHGSWGGFSGGGGGGGFGGFGGGGFGGGGAGGSW